MPPRRIPAVSAVQLVNSILTAHSSFDAIRYAIVKLKRLAVASCPPDDAEPTQAQVKRIFKAILDNKIDYDEFLRRLRDLFKPYLSNMQELESMLSDFDSLNISMHVNHCRSGVRLNQGSYRAMDGVALVIFQDTPESALDFRFCSRSPTSFIARPPQFLPNSPFFKIGKVVLSDKDSKMTQQPPGRQLRIPPGLFFDFPFLKHADLSQASGMTSLPDRLFYRCSSLEVVDLPDELKRLGTSCFAMSGLKVIVIPAAVTTIGARCFDGAERLSSIGLAVGTRIKDIRNFAFRDCYSLRRVVFPEHDVKLGTGAFQRCFNLGTIKLSEHQTAISACCFQNCEQVKEIVIPKSVKKLGRSCFRECLSLSTVTIDPRPDKLQIENSVFVTCPLKALNLAQAQFVNIEKRWLPALPASLEVVLLASDMVQHAVLSSSACQGRKRPRVKDMPPSILHFSTKDCAVLPATREGREQFKIQVYKKLGRPSFLPRALLTVPKLPAWFKDVFSLCCYGGDLNQSSKGQRKLKSALNVPKEVWMLVLQHLV